MNANFDYCRDLVAQADRDRYLASLYAPEAARGALYALYAFNVEIARVRDVAREPAPGEIRLQWWREVLQGERAGEAAAHPVAAALLETLARHRLAGERLVALIDARTFDLYDEPIDRIADLDGYAARTGGTVVALAAQILGRRAAANDTVAEQTGVALCYAGILRGFARDAARGQLYLPLDLLGRFGGDQAGVFAGKATFELRAALAEMRLIARRHLSEANRLLPQADDAILPALLPAALVRPSLARMETANYDPFGFEDLPAWRRQWLLWRAARDRRRIFG